MDDVALTKAVCQVLADRNGWAWRPAGPPYTATEVGVFYGALGATPDRAVGVTLYGGEDELQNGLAVRRVQVRHRGARGRPDGADELASRTFTALQGLARVAGISLATRVLVARLGADENDRQERADSYQIILDNPEAS
jgi:hypothetical protein